MASYSAKKIQKGLKLYIKKISVKVMILFLVFLSVVLIAASSYIIIYNSRIYPNTTITGIYVSGFNMESAIELLSSEIKEPDTLDLKFQEQNFSLKTKEIGLEYDIPLSVIEAYTYTRTGNFYNDIKKRFSLLSKKKDFELKFSIDDEKLSNFVSMVAGQLSDNPVEPEAMITNSKIVINKGIKGKEVRQKELKETILNHFSSNSKEVIEVPVEELGYTLTDDQISTFSMRAEKFLGKSLLLKFEYKTFNLKESDILKLLSPESSFKDHLLENILNKISNLVERKPQNPKFVFQDGRVTEFQPALDGIEVDREKLKDTILKKLEDLENIEEKRMEAEIPVLKTAPDISTGEINNLGINELIGRGVSTFYHSIPDRVYNVALATSRINGTLIKPGETFSFNAILGDVSAFTGYKQAYIISGGKTILGDGGGVCQVSTTLFRAVLNAGLPVNERQSHAYRVGYYEQDSPPGFDATVFSPSPDFKFTNDTPFHILIQASVDTKNYTLVFEIYGTKDGRSVKISKPSITGVVAPPPDVYQDDPNLPVGTVKQVDYKAWGAKVTFSYVVTKNGQEIINKVFVSNYKPWGAIYLRGTGVAN